jgi:hypothetical protein
MIAQVFCAFVLQSYRPARGLASGAACGLGLPLLHVILPVASPAPHRLDFATGSRVWRGPGVGHVSGTKRPPQIRSRYSMGLEYFSRPTSGGRVREGLILCR